ncbi:MAG: EamA/RhaT family transporter, partial [Gemmobacter sp.]
YEVAEASAVQPFAFLQLVFSSAIGIAVFADVLTWNIALGAAVVVGAGLFTLWRARVRAQG